MAVAKRIFLFIATNILVVLTLSIVLNLLGVRGYITAYGINYESLLFFCLIWGFGGALISLALSRISAKWMMGVKVIDPNTHDPQLRELVQAVHSLARRAGLPAMPEVGVYDSMEVNAFATGPTRSRSLVAVSRGLLQSMNRNALEGVLGHEVAHIANGDMVTLTLLQGVVNAFVMFLARVIAFALQQVLRGDRDRDGGLGGFSYMITVWVLEFVFMILGSMVVMWFSRQREYRADAGSAKIAGRENMSVALRSLLAVQKGGFDEANESRGQSLAAFKIAGGGGGKFSWTSLLRSHPPLEDRIRRLESAGVVR